MKPTLRKAMPHEAGRAYDLFDRALRKLTNEGKAELFGGMTPEGVNNSLKGCNCIYLAEREGDRIPVAAVSILRQPEKLTEYDELLEKTGMSGEKAILNALAVRPELWGQGYGRQVIELCVEELRKTGVKIALCIAHPSREEMLRKIFKRATGKDNIVSGEEYVWKTVENERLRKKFVIEL